jgi:hypothetical protein
LSPPLPGVPVEGAGAGLEEKDLIIFLLFSKLVNYLLSY